MYRGLRVLGRSGWSANGARAAGLRRCLGGMAVRTDDGGRKVAIGREVQRWQGRGMILETRRGFAKKKKGAEEIVKVPEMGESIIEGTISSWLKHVGDHVETDDIIGQIETDKITVDVRAPKNAVITALLAEEGETVSVGADLIKLGSADDGGAVPTPPAPTESAAATAAPAETAPASSSEAGESDIIQVPEMGESITEATIVSWDAQPGETFVEDQVLAQLETDKITVDVRAPKAGKMISQLAKEGDTVSVGKDIISVVYGNFAGDAPSAPAEAKTPAPEPQADSSTPPPPPPPVAEEQSSSMDDVTSKLEALGKIESGERRVAMTRMRKRIAERLKEAQNTAAILTTFNEVDMSALMNLRNDYKDDFHKKHNVKLGFMSPFIKASAVALLEQPDVNAYIDGGDIVYRDYVDISVAVSTPTGLVVPAIRGVESMSFADIEKTIFQLGEKARDGNLTLEELQGGTFTISNGGVFGSLLSTPIINMPQSAILGMHAIQKRPVVVNDEIVIRPMMYLALSYDHRLIDGKEAVTFLRRLKTLIEDPRRLLLNINL